MTPEFSPTIYKSPDDLPPGLERYIARTRSVTVLRHPFYTDIFPLAVPMPIDELLVMTKERAEAARAAGDFQNFVFLHTRPFRMDALRMLQLGDVFASTPEAYWKIARHVWLDSEQPEDDLRWRYLIEADVPGREAMMLPKDRDALSQMSQTLTLCRGLQAPTRREALEAALSGFSWTLDDAIAAKFAHRHLAAPDHPWIARVKIPKTGAIAYLTGRGEEEIILDSAGLSEEDIALEEAGAAPRSDFVSLKDFSRS